MEILSYFPSVPVPCLEYIPDDGYLPASYRDRFDAVYALSHACCALRLVYYPLLWRTMDVCVLPEPVPRRQRDQAKAMATELVHQAEVVTIRAPHLAERVQ